MSRDVLSVEPIAVEAPPANLPPITPVEQVALEQKRLTGVNWFFWIVGLTLINTLVVLAAGSDWGFPIGLGLTQFIDYFALTLISESPADALIFQLIAFAIDLAILMPLFVFGLLARRRHLWAIIAGMVLYALDGVVVFYFELWVGVLFHLLALWGLWNGYQATRLLNQLAATNRLASQATAQESPTVARQDVFSVQAFEPTRPKGLGRRFWATALLLSAGIIALTAVFGQVWAWFLANP